MKKLTSLLLCIVMLMSLAVTAFAAVDEVTAKLTVTSVSSTSENASISNNTYRLTDGVISPDDMGSLQASAYYFYANYSVNPGVLTIKITADEEVAFSGIRFYSRRNDGAGVQPIRSNDNIGKATISVSDDGNTYIASDVLTSVASSDYRYVDIKFMLDKTAYSVSGVKYIKIDVSAYFNASWRHLGIEEIKLLTPDSENVKTVTALKKEYLKKRVSDLSAYLVTGGLERKAIIDEAEAIINNLSNDDKEELKTSIAELEKAKSYYTSSRQEINTSGNMVAESAKSLKSDGSINRSLGSYALLTDGFVTSENDNGKVNNSDAFCRGDNSIDTDAGTHLLVTLKLTEPVVFSGIRSYTRKFETDKWSAKIWMAENVNITLYDENNNSISFNGISPIIADTSKGERGNSYGDYMLTDSSNTYSVSGVTKIEFDIIKLYDKNKHWGAEELRLLTATGEAKTVEEIKTGIIASEAESAASAINSINTRVTGSIENVNTINAAKAAYHGLSAEAKSLVDEETLSVLTNAENALSGVVKEIDTTPGSRSKISVTGTCDNGATVGNTARLTDGLFSPNGEVGNTYYSGADFAVYPDANKYLHLTVTMTEAQNVSGIRFYTRKAWDSVNLNKNNNAKSAKVTLYSGDAYVTSDIITLTQSSDSIYCDAALKFNSEQITVTNVTKIEIIVLENIDQAHWGAEELRLLETNGTEKSVSDIAKTLVTLSTPTFESGVYENGTGIIRFFTKFESIADGAEIESFGTYAHEDLVSEKNTCATYEGVTPKADDNFSVDVTGITAEYFNKPVFALSFVKIKGYDNLILSDISTGATVNTENKLK